MNRPVQQTSEFVQTALIEGSFPTSDKLSAARDVTLDELRSFANALLAETDPVMLAHGNLTRAATLNMAKQVSALVLDDGKRTTVERSGLRQLPQSQTNARIEVDHPDTGYTLYLQGQNTSYPERARFRLLAQIVSSPFYEEIRTSRQLGYIVQASNFEILETPALGLIVQSPTADGTTIDNAVAEFSESFAAKLGNLDEKRLDREKQAVISQLLENDRQLDDISSRYWREIDRQNHQFNSREQLADAIRQVTHEELRETFRQTMLERQRALQVVTDKDETNEKDILEELRQRPPMDSAATQTD